MPRTILYVDDDVALARLAERHLGRAGYNVVTAVDGESAMAAFEKGGIDAIVLDHYLRAETGMDIFHRLQGRGCSAPVIYVTGSSEATIAIEAMKNGASDYVIKTVGDEFLPLMQNAIGQAISTADLWREKEKADQEIRIGKERAEILLAEVNHRVANSLALVAAMIRLQAGSSKNEDVKAALAETQARIAAIAGMHRSLYTSDDVRQVEMDKYLGTLVNEVQGTVTDRQGATIHLSADEVMLTSDRAVSVGMIVTELLTNALKYAYEPGTDGEVRVLLTRQPDDKALLAVEDDGIGWKEGDVVRGTGLGSRIVKSMASTLGSAIQYVERPKGTRAEMTIDLSI
ncbi:MULTISPECIES: sensor histidine kinase [Rhizobiaceae]|jgi:two-component sensor histidine kinase|uniref:histidine kinase n=1 Tax=Aliirhizobium cellulosilyticum TaxID=393664 RepID=A0A7W6TEG0_9HYPH|nr:histidine kinase dimerization/phosphoacceptor domain -containing protein [Rhizobium cellulosilyticum]MBB4346811.1 two-component sensor histidine kinase [Rhizobium cellulosilyticum]MBB4410795.1 two-component sensor histidine kinase [Rhizobium cellulosilyticum]MBB4445483.1 two-component sensor histidine kinase [Rhizobium cellulosilyticum]